jgi:hypothetical protein
MYLCEVPNPLGVSIGLLKDMRVKEETLNTVAVAILFPYPFNFDIISTGHRNPVSRYRFILHSICQ